MEILENPKSKDDANWKIWYQDTFDRECPRQIEVEGNGLILGLIELWKRHLFESVQDSNWRGFSHFDMWWEQEKNSIKIVGNLDGQKKLRRWIYSKIKEPKMEGLPETVDEELLRKIAEVHRIHIMQGETSEAIIDLASETDKREDFENQLKQYLE